MRLANLLEGKAALITGGAGRLGRVIAATFEREGARVAATDIGQGAPAPWPFFAGDASDPDALASVIDRAEEAIGPLDTLVTCAAVYPNRAVLDMAPGDWDRVFEVNVRGPMLAAKLLGARWIERGTKGAIVNLSSAAARSARRGAAAYCGSKAALEMLTEVLAIEFGPHGIRVNAVAPGLVMDEMVTEASPGLHPYYAMMLQGTPLGRTGAPADIAEAVAFLASDRSAWTTGAVLDVTGGSHTGRPHVPWTTDIR